MLHRSVQANIGFSHSDAPAKALEASTEDLYTFLEAFMRHFPQYATQDFYIVGESFAGISTPAIARKIHQKQSSPLARLVRSTLASTRATINLRGIALANAQVSNRFMWLGYYVTGCLGDNPLFNGTICDAMAEANPRCEEVFKICEEADFNVDVCNSAIAYCRPRSVDVIDLEHRNPYDIRQICTEEDSCNQSLAWVTRYLNSERTKKSLQIDPGIEYKVLDLDVYNAYVASGDSQHDSIFWVEELLEQVRPHLTTLLTTPQKPEMRIDYLIFHAMQGYEVLIYAGNKDWLCNSAGALHVAENVRWRRQPEFQARELQSLRLRDRSIGKFKQEGGLAFVEVFDAGHSAPQDKREETLYMINSWVRHRLH